MTTSTRIQIMCSWSGMVFLFLFLAGWVLISGYLPPHSPTMTAAEVTAFYQAHPFGIRLGLVVSMLSMAFYIPFSAVLSAQMARIEGPFPVAAYTQLVSAAGTVITFIVPIVIWQAAAFRTDRNPDLILLLNDLAWIPFVGASAPFYITPIAVAVAGFQDKREHPIFPRWACFYNVWATFLVLPGSLIVMFKQGPFAWNGLIGWWLPLTNFAIWFSIMTYLLIKGIKRHAAADSAILPV